MFKCKKIGFNDIVKYSSILILGLIFPSISVFQAFIGVKSLTQNVSYNITMNELVNKFKILKKDLSSNNDYALFSLIYTEHANQKTMLNKQILKSAIIQSGFAAISIGIMLILFGINDGGIESSADVSSFKFDFKTGSSGIAIVILGCTMVTAGGILPNEYKTVGIPRFASSVALYNYDKSVSAYKYCLDKNGKLNESCFVERFELINFKEIE